MPWKESTPMSQRSEFLTFAGASSVNLSELCRRFGISRKTGYKWRRRAQLNTEGVGDRSRRPQSSPRRTAPGVEAHVLAIRQRYPFYGGRKIRRLLVRDGVQPPPAASTITAILDRHGLLRSDRRRTRNWQRFEEAAPNASWQMDFKGHFPLSRGRCHPLTVLDDHSRFCICLAACTDEQDSSVRRHLRAAFQRYGLPERMLMDNGGPWGSSGQGLHTRLTAWLMRVGIFVSHCRPHHPQTQGKDERFHRTLKLEVISQRPAWYDQAEVQVAFDRYRPQYNFERPHEALAFEVPGARYAPSPRVFPAVLPTIEYDADFLVRRVQENGRIKLKGLPFFIGKAFAGDPVGLRQVGEAEWDVYYCNQRVAAIDLLATADGKPPRVNKPATHGSLRAQDGVPLGGGGRNAAGRGLVDAQRRGTSHDEV